MKLSKKQWLLIGLIVVATAMEFANYRNKARFRKLERNGNEVVAKIDSFGNKHHRLPKSLAEVGIEKDNGSADGTYRFKEYLLTYEPTPDGCYWLAILYGHGDDDYVYHPLLGRWGTSFNNEAVNKRKAEMLDSLMGLYGTAITRMEYDSIGPNTRRLNPGLAAPPDSMGYERDYYADGQLAAEGWITWTGDREDGFAGKVGKWRYHTKGSIMIEHNYGSK